MLEMLETDREHLIYCFISMIKIWIAMVTLWMSSLIAWLISLIFVLATAPLPFLAEFFLAHAEFINNLLNILIIVGALIFLSHSCLSPKRKKPDNNKIQKTPNKTLR